MNDETANDETAKFLGVTQAAEKMYEALSELRQRTEDYSEAGKHLEWAATATQALADATTQALDEQGRRWDELKRVLDGNLKPSLDSLRQNSEKQTKQLAQNSRTLDELKPSLARLESASAGLSNMLQEQSRVLGGHQQAIEGLMLTTKHAVSAGIWAVVVSLVTLIVLVVHLLM